MQVSYVFLFHVFYKGFTWCPQTIISSGQSGRASSSQETEPQDTNALMHVFIVWTDEAQLFSKFLSFENNMHDHTH